MLKAYRNVFGCDLAPTQFGRTNSAHYFEEDAFNQGRHASADELVSVSAALISQLCSECVIQNEGKSDRYVSPKVLLADGGRFGLCNAESNLMSSL
jgi:hypothetical protein